MKINCENRQKIIQKYSQNLIEDNKCIQPTMFKSAINFDFLKLRIWFSTDMIFSYLAF